MSDQPAEYDHDLILAMERAGYAVRTRTEYNYLLDSVVRAEDEADRLRAQLKAAQETVSFFASVIHSGEQWTPVCEHALRAAFAKEGD